MANGSSGRIFNLLNQVSSQKRQQQAAIQKLFMEALIKAKIKQAFAEPKAATAKDLLGIASGITPSETVFSQEDIAGTLPPDTRTLGGVEGGEVITPQGARFEEGQIISPGGKTVGEFLPGFEPKTALESFPRRLQQRLGVTEKEAKRKFLGLGKAKEVKKISKDKKLTTSEKKAIGRIESTLTLLEQGGFEDADKASMGLFIASIQKAGFDPTDPIFEDILEKARKTLEKSKPKGFLRRFR